MMRTETREGRIVTVLVKSTLRILACGVAVIAVAGALGGLLAAFGATVLVLGATTHLLHSDA
jgi:hypothetical protein